MATDADTNVETNDAVDEVTVPTSVEEYIARITADEETAKLAEIRDAPEPETEETEETTEETAGAEETPEVPAVATGLDRLAAREEEVRKKEVDFDARVTAAVRAKLPDFRGKSPEDVLKLAGWDPDLALKQMMFEKASPDNPVRAKLKDELRDYHTKKEIDSMRAELENRDREATQRQYFQTVTDGARKHVESVDEKVAPVFAAVAKTKPDYAHQRIMQVIVQDAQTRFARGEDGEPMSYADAVKAVEVELGVVAEALKAKNVSVTKPSTPGNTPVLTTKKPIVKPKKELSHEETIQAAIDGAMRVFEREETKSRTTR